MGSLLILLSAGYLLLAKKVVSLRKLSKELLGQYRTERFETHEETENN